VLAEAKAAGLAFDLIAVREGDKLPFHTDARVTLTPAAFRAATQTVTPQGAIAIARVHEASPGEAIDAARTDNKNSVLMRVKSGGSSRFVAVPLAKG